MLQIVQPVLLVLTLLFLLYDRFIKPETSLELEVGKMKEACKYKHKSIDENIVMIKENHLRHIENNIEIMKGDIVEIKTTLKERQIFK